MKNTIKYTFLSALFLGFAACDVDNTLPEIKGEAENTVALNAGSADFSKYVAVGASFTAGFTDGALFKAGQQNSFPNILASKFAMVGGGAFEQPLMSDNVGGMLNPMTGQAQDGLKPRLYFNGEGPVRISETPSTILGMPATNAGSLNNMGVPGAKSYHLDFDGYGNAAGLQLGLANPYFVRMASSSGTSILKDALAQQPTFFTLSEIGGNDVLDYAVAGGYDLRLSRDAVYQENNTDPTTYGSNDITSPALFKIVYDGVIEALTSDGAKGVVANVPYITSLPFFTTVPNDALEIDAATAANLTGFFQAVAGIFTQGLVMQGVPLADAQKLASQYAITFSEGKNRWIIDVPKTQMNPLGFRQMTKDELVLLTIDRDALKNGYGSVVLTPEVLQVLGILKAGGTPTAQQAGLVIAAVSGLDDKDVLDSTEINNIIDATDKYNLAIEAAASSKGLAFVDFNTILDQASTTGLEFGNYNMNTSLVTGGLVSLDGIHLTGRGYALMANKMLAAIDATYGSNFTVGKDGLAKADDYPTNYSPTLQ